MKKQKKERKKKRGDYNFKTFQAMSLLQLIKLYQTKVMQLLNRKYPQQFYDHCSSDSQCLNKAPYYYMHIILSRAYKTF